MIEPQTNMESSETLTLPQAEYLTKRQVAALLGVSPRTVENLMRARRIPFVKLTRKLVRFPRTAVVEYINQNLTIRAFGQERTAASS